MTATPQDVQSLIDSAVASLEKVTGRFNVNGKNWKPALADLASARSEAGELVAPPAPPPPTPPTPSPTSSKLFGIYLDPEGSPSSYLAEFQAADAALPNLDFGMLPLDKSVVNGIGKPNQVLLVPAGCTAARWDQYGAPAAATGLVSHALVVDEPGSDPASLELIKTVCGFVKATSPNLKTVVTQFSPGTLTTLANADEVDCLSVDAYPARPTWNMATWNSCMAACEAAVAAGKISEFWTTLDAFTAPNYPAPTAAELLTQIQAALASNATRLIAYAWGVTGGTPLINLPGLISDLLTIPA